MITTIVFEDHGQDFLQWDIQNGVVVDSRPFQTWVWFGRIAMNDFLQAGDFVRLDGGHTIKYPIVEVRPNQPVGKKIALELVSKRARDLICTSVDDVKSGLRHTDEHALREALAYLANHDQQKTKFRLIRAALLRRKKEAE